jgi:hypothetical protein
MKEPANFNSGNISSGGDLNLNSISNHQSTISSLLNLASYTNVTISINCASNNSSACGQSSDNIFMLPSLMPDQVKKETLLSINHGRTSLVPDRVEPPNFIETEQ